MGFITYDRNYIVMRLMVKKKFARDVVAFAIFNMGLRPYVCRILFYIYFHLIIASKGLFRNAPLYRSAIVNIYKM